MLALVSLESRVPPDHPLRAVKALVDAMLASMSADFDEAYSIRGRPSIPPERLLKAMLLMALYTVRSERLFCEQLTYNMLFMWFLDMDLQESAFDHSVFSKNRERFLDADLVGKFFSRVVELARSGSLMSDEHFSVDGTLLEAWGSLKSFRPKDDDSDDNNGFGDFKGTKRSNDTHESKTDPDAKLYRKGQGKEAKLSYMGHILMENRNGLIVEVEVTEASGTAERTAALDMLDRNAKGDESHTQDDAEGPSKRRNRTRTVGADKAYDTKDFVERLRDRGVTPQVAQNANSRRSSNIDGRTTRHPGYKVSQTKRMLIEGIYGWMKEIGGSRRSRYRGRDPTALWFRVAATAFNLIRIPKLMAATAG